MKAEAAIEMYGAEEEDEEQISSIPSYDKPWYHPFVLFAIWKVVWAWVRRGHFTFETIFSTPKEPEKKYAILTLLQVDGDVMNFIPDVSKHTDDTDWLLAFEAAWLSQQEEIKEGLHHFAKSVDLWAYILCIPVFLTVNAKLFYDLIEIIRQGIWNPDYSLYTELGLFAVNIIGGPVILMYAKKYLFQSLFWFLGKVVNRFAGKFLPF